MGNFLSECYEKRKSYSTINTFLSALSSSLYPINGIAIGSHPLITRLLKGIYNLRIPTPRYSTTWDVTTVTIYLKTLFSLAQLSLKNLTLKTVMLRSLSSAQRERTLFALKLNNQRVSDTCLTFIITERLKTSKPGKSIEVRFECLPDDPKICPKCNLAEYILRTEALRGSNSDERVSKLFISYVKPHKHVSTDTLARWIKSILKVSGIDTSVFKAHSVRSASTSHAYARGIPIAEILRTADWSNEKTFRKYYLGTGQKVQGRWLENSKSREQNFLAIHPVSLLLFFMVPFRLCTKNNDPPLFC